MLSVALPPDAVFLDAVWRVHCGRIVMPLLVPDADRPSMARRVVPTAASPLVLDRDGHCATVPAGLDQQAFSRRTRFFHVAQHPWSTLIGMSLCAYVFVVCVFALGYYALCAACGFDVTVALAFYFSTVTLPGNGGYLGEDPRILRPFVAGSCFQYRALLVHAESYVNVIFAAVLAAIFVRKAAAARVLRHRIVFSDAVTRGTRGERECRFRIAHAHGDPLVNAELRVYAITVADRAVRTAEVDYTLMEEAHSGGAASRRLLLLCPVTVCFPSPGDGTTIVAVVTATDPVSCESVHARHTYMPRNVVDGASFEQDVVSVGSNGRVSVDYRSFNTVSGYGATA